MIVGASVLRPNEPLGNTPGGTDHSARWIALWGRDLDLGRAAHRVMGGLKWGEGVARVRHLGYPVWAMKLGPALFLRLGAILVWHG